MENKIPDNWVETLLSDAVFFQEGPGLRTMQMGTTGMPFLNIRTFNDDETLDKSKCKFVKMDEFKNKYEHFLLNEGDIVVSSSGTLGKAIVIRREDLPIMLNTSVIRFRALSEELMKQKFLKYFLKTDYFYKQIQHQKTGMAIDNFGPSHLLQMNIVIPPLAEQHRIVAKLDAVMQKVESNKQRLEKIPKLLKRFRQSVLAAAVTGRLTGEWREKCKLFNLELNDLISIRKKNYLETGRLQKKQNKSVPKLPEFHLLENKSIPSNWLAITVESATTFIIDCLHSTPKFTEIGELCIDTTNIEPFNIQYKSARKVTKESFNERIGRMTPLKGDVLFSREGTIGTAALYNGEYPICLGQRMMMFRFASFVSPNYAEIYLASHYFRALYTPLISGTSAQHLNIGHVRSLEFVLPSLEEQKEIVRRVEQLFAFADKLEARYAKAKAILDKLPQSILAKAFRGELVPQNPNDEPASVLLERIKAKKVLGQGQGKKKTKVYAIEVKPLKNTAAKKGKDKKAKA